MQQFLKNIPRMSSNIRTAASSFSTTAAAVSDSILVSEKNNLVKIVLNKPKALNALNLEMCNNIKSLLLNKINAKDSKYGAFLVKGEGNKAFCAGGDVKSIWENIENLKKNPEAAIGTGKPGDIHADFFRQEYIMINLLATSNAPQVSLWDGIVMGGGVGVSILGEFRVATEKSLFAMPETAIGIFPDVGSSAWLPHLSDGYGNYIGLTGIRLRAVDLVHSGIATHYMSSEKLAEFEEEVSNNVPVDPIQSRKFLKDILDKYQSLSEKPKEETSLLFKNKDSIKRCFGEEVQSVEEIYKKLDEELAINEEWARETLNLLNKMCPFSLKLTFSQLNKGKKLDLQQCLQMEYRMMMKCMKGGNFSEGIRALLVDKDNKPVWNPPTLAEVKDEDVEEYFESLGEYDLHLFSN